MRAAASRIRGPGTGGSLGVRVDHRWVVQAHSPAKKKKWEKRCFPRNDGFHMFVLLRKPPTTRIRLIEHSMAGSKQSVEQLVLPKELVEKTRAVQLETKILI